MSDGCVSLLSGAQFVEQTRRPLNVIDQIGTREWLLMECSLVIVSQFVPTLTWFIYKYLAVRKLD